MVALASVRRLRARWHQEHSALRAFARAFLAHIRVHRAGMLDIRCQRGCVYMLAVMPMMLILTVVGMDGAVTMILLMPGILLSINRPIPLHDSLPISLSRRNSGLLCALCGHSC